MLAPLIEEKERLLLTTEVRTSPERLRELLTEDFFEIGSSGRVLYKEDDTNTMDLGEIDITLSDFNLEVIRDDVVLATYRTENHATEKTTLRSSIWVRIDGVWKMRFHQGTPAQ
ncbi:DUF4440 domain-containing protein [Exiguobacterium sp. SH3S2]|uniref:nuclear transport factor 2 family protein n=1 Tax=unclassified Exiguobacterium TaxID=2644629 RepID=UPI00103CDF38|nr:MULTISPECIES: DUF4440 domain-containing protein [unclassified Exiguobacterium]TCI46150.1 DUF4440 domain-containing protein [Exiguobacterium sp. SH3S3]TCI52862.1 DUF4440 domain-containing protein [Exiguobacterium sp. SH5S13]TCI61238.1 DUF4440 domain-containing protein [Exiguobacterium sp. SH3S2]